MVRRKINDQWDDQIKAKINVHVFRVTTDETINGKSTTKVTTIRIIYPDFEVCSSCGISNSSNNVQS